MSFLQPILLLALPLVALPVVIHLVHQYRHRSVPWAAMMFLVRARRMNQGMARLRYWLIMLMRMLAVLGLILAVSRPLSTGWWSGLGAAKAEVTLVLLDRSASMELRDIQTGESKRSTALGKLAGLLGTRAAEAELVLIDSATREARRVESVRALPDLPFAAATAAGADIPGLLEVALGYLEANDAGSADVWICSDLAETDWDAGSGRWAVIREKLASRKGVRIFLLSYPGSGSGNLAVRVSGALLERRGEKSELVMDLEVLGVKEAGVEVGGSVALEFELGGVRSVVEVQLERGGAELKGHRIPVESGLESGWGRVRLPGDSNLLDSSYYFVFAERPLRRSVVVAEDAGVGEALRLALSIPAESGLRQEADLLGVGQAGSIDWESTGLVVWQGPLPEGRTAELLEQFAGQGRRVMFFPSAGAGEGEFLGVRWGAEWEVSGEPKRVGWWRGDADLLGRTGSGEALPVEELRAYRGWGMEHGGTVLGRFDDDQPFLVRVSEGEGVVYFCGVLPVAESSSLERDGIVFYAMLQRALMEGSAGLSRVGQRDAGGGVMADREDWERVARWEGGVAGLAEGLVPGVYRSGDEWVAVNRPVAEDLPLALPASAVDGLFEGAVYERIEDEVGNVSPLAREVWRLFLVAMMLALVGEALLCLPSVKPKAIPRAGFERMRERMGGGS